MSRALLGAENAQALLGAWHSVVGWQNSGQPTNLYHGVYGGHRAQAYPLGWPQPQPQYVQPQYVQPQYVQPQYVQPQYVQVPVYDQEPMYQPPQMAVPYAIPPRNVLVDQPGPSRADRILLPMSSGVNILPNTSAQITSRPQNVAFRPERIIIGGTPGDWIINDIKVGNRSQFSQSGDVPGETFASTAIDSFVSFETVQTAMDFVMLVTFVGTSETGAPFVCSVLGTAAV